LEQNREKIAAHGLGLAAISYDSIGVLKAFADRQHIGFDLLSDPESKVIRSYGILNESGDRNSPFFGIPHPGTYVLDPRGVVVGKYFEDDYRVRDTVASILLRQFGLAPAPHEAIEAKHLKLSVSGAANPVRPGQRLTLAIDLDLPERMHVYAPGVSGYIPIALKLESSSGFKADAVAFPPAKTLRLEAIHETAPVYERQFRLLQTLTLGSAQQIEPLLDANRDLIIKGELRYQACDDRECFLPEMVPLKWAVHILPFDRTRAPESLQRKR
jgi:hypothetical protein